MTESKSRKRKVEDITPTPGEKKARLGQKINLRDVTPDITQDLLLDFLGNQDLSRYSMTSKENLEMAREKLDTKQQEFYQKQADSAQEKLVKIDWKQPDKFDKFFVTLNSVSNDNPYFNKPAAFIWADDKHHAFQAENFQPQFFDKYVKSANDWMPVLALFIRKLVRSGENNILPVLLFALNSKLSFQEKFKLFNTFITKVQYMQQLIQLPNGDKIWIALIPYFDAWPIGQRMKYYNDLQTMKNAYIQHIKKQLVKPEILDNPWEIENINRMYKKLAQGVTEDYFTGEVDEDAEMPPEN